MKMTNHEDDISAEEEIQSKGTRIPQENEYYERTQGLSFKKSKG